MGCADCTYDYDFCTDCSNGFVWNNDFTCIPAVIGLEAASQNTIFIFKKKPLNYLDLHLDLKLLFYFENIY